METVVVTASAGSFPGLAEALSRLSLTVEEHPLIDFRAPSDWSSLDRALDRLSSYGAVALTSPRAASVLADRIEQRVGASGPQNDSPVVWAAGAATAAALRGTMGAVRTAAGRSTAEGGAGVLAQAMIAARVPGPVLFPCGDRRREELPQRLRREGLQVDEVLCYHSILASESDARAVAAQAHLLIVASPSVAQLLIRACPPGSRPALIAAGSTTAESARAGGWEPEAVASQPTAEAVAAAVQTALARRSTYE